MEIKYLNNRGEVEYTNKYTDKNLFVKTCTEISECGIPAVICCANKELLKGLCLRTED